jgi:predicted phosphodiesterase
MINRIMGQPEFRQKRRITPSIVFLFSLLFVSNLVAQPITASASYEFSCFNITPGSDGGKLNFSWFTTFSDRTVVLQIARSDAQEAAGFPEADAKPFVGTVHKIVATQLNVDARKVALDRYANDVTASGLADSTRYLYRIGDGVHWSESHSLTMRNQLKFNFLLVGDPQLGAKSSGPKTLDADAAGWRTTIEKALNNSPEASFLVSLGDQVNDYNSLATQDAEYLAYFSPTQFMSLPVATIDGNHDIAMGEYYGFHYNQPNRSLDCGTSYVNDGDYWFVYGDALFLMLNSNTESVATHDTFIKDAIDKNPGAKWRIACFHHSIYSEAGHYSDPDIIDRRNNYPPVLERYKIDIVFQGHDHVYARSFPMREGKPVVGSAAGGPSGIVYFTFDSGSGSKYNDWKEGIPNVYSAQHWQGNVPSFSDISVVGDKLSVTTYRTDSMGIIDSYTLEKDK